MRQDGKKNNVKKITHTVNNLLTSIQLSSEILLKEFYGKVNRQQKKYLSTIITEGKKIQRLIKKLKQD